MNAGSGLQTVLRALDVLEVFGRRPWAYTLADLARATGIHRAILQRIVATLWAKEFLVRDEATLVYSLGPAIRTLAGSKSDEEICIAAASSVQKLAAETGETVWLAAVHGTDVICIDQIESTQLLRVVRPMGFAHPLYVGSAGRAILAFMSPDVLADLLEQWSGEKDKDGRRFDRNQLLARLEDVRKKGYAFTSGEIADEASGLSAPVFAGSSDKVIASIGLVGPASRFKGAELARRVGLVRKAAEETSRHFSSLNKNRKSPASAAAGRGNVRQGNRTPA